MCLCVCVRARACVRACVCVCVFAGAGPAGAPHVLSRACARGHAATLNSAVGYARLKDFLVGAGEGARIAFVEDVAEYRALVSVAKRRDLYAPRGMRRSWGQCSVPPHVRAGAGRRSAKVIIARYRRDATALRPEAPLEGARQPAAHSVKVAPAISPAAEKASDGAEPPSPARARSDSDEEDAKRRAAVQVCAHGDGHSRVWACACVE